MTVTEKQAKEFISKIAPIIRVEAKARGYKVASPVIAQACLESAFGTCALSKYYNYFGLKCGSVWKGASVNMNTKEEYKAGTLTSIKANFRVYGSMEEGVAGYYVFINFSRYENLKTAATAREYLERIKADGYATDSNYVKSNMSVVEKYGLTAWDNFTAGTEQITAAEIDTPQKPDYAVGKTYKLQDNMYVRKAPRGEKKKLSELTANGQKNAYENGGSAILRKGTAITCLAAETASDGSVWLKIPSGYVCAKAGEKIYIK